SIDSITEKMDDLWELYNDKVKPFENTDDSYKELASDVKDDYTGFFEGLGEALMDPIKDSFDLLRGFVSGAVDLVKGVAILASDAGIVLVSSQIPDPIEPAFLKDKNDEIVEDYSNSAKQVIDNPLIVAEMVAQSVSDTVEEEGAMFATGEVLTGCIPVAGGLKYAKEGAVLKNVGKKPKSSDKELKIDNRIEHGIQGWTLSEGGGVIRGRSYSQHALERMAPDTPEVRATLSRRAIKKAEELGYKPQTEEFNDLIKKYVEPRDIPPFVIEDAIMNTNRIPGKTK